MRRLLAHVRRSPSCSRSASCCRCPAGVLPLPRQHADDVRDPGARPRSAARLVGAVRVRPHRVLRHRHLHQRAAAEPPRRAVPARRTDRGGARRLRRPPDRDSRRRVCAPSISRLPPTRSPSAPNGCSAPGTSLTKGSDGLRISAPDIFGYVVGTDRRAFPVMAIILALVLLSMFYLIRSKLGRDLCTIRDSEHVASASGIDVKRTKVDRFRAVRRVTPGSRAAPTRCSSRSSTPTPPASPSSSWCSPWWWSAAAARSPACWSAWC